MSSTTTATTHTIKLVVVGASGVGKTSIRGQFISGGFSSGYRATIGADFIAKTLPHPTKPENTVTLQIWDTAGQERFSSLSTAFFRGADAVILMFDVHRPESLEALKKWWAEFCVGVPLAEEDYPEHPCFIVGNKIDLEVSEGESQPDTISISQIQQFVEELMPLQISVEDDSSAPAQIKTSTSIHIGSQASSVDATRSKSPSRIHSSSPSSNKFNSMSSLNTTPSLYHTPSSSMFSDIFHTARSSPEPAVSSSTSSTSSPSPREVSILARQRRLTVNSTRSGSSSSAATMTPSLFAREQQENAAGSSSHGTTSTTPEEGIVDLPSSLPSSGQPPPLPERGPSLHFTSAKTGEGVRNLFEHVAARVIRKSEYEEYFEARRMHYREGSLVETIRLGVDGRKQTGKIGNLVKSNCCS
ncbi:hypothetical protein AGABI1DRAFT_108006 [Agaricus bisporus var. burnettii JB137-S8]|uniref:Ras-domain-containing protein n=1 Tax=Agaricus bisporus var. burnettii (strain JB137-S8 / ATCC MYA-4627 / FGSC 10392) TaxID=597362 RepID=K5XRG9_AGABU|nr:uncharacterized protein AGABI1DRAFT_108006 [Agaricus bisporus var. burnettii JB137-S8]EKM77475.1 hypothetical protein AGABI1DRAFT_108006 [Agaricus bisporus var. burnettii JB137-S8]